MEKIDYDRINDELEDYAKLNFNPAWEEDSGILVIYEEDADNNGFNEIIVYGSSCVSNLTRTGDGYNEPFYYTYWVDIYIEKILAKKYDEKGKYIETIELPFNEDKIKTHYKID